MNDPKLKLAMARLLPEKMCTEGDLPGWKGVGYIVTDVLETEWLYVMHLVEQTLTLVEIVDYLNNLRAELHKIKKPASDFDMLSATFNQRAAAMCKVKGITV